MAILPLTLLVGLAINASLAGIVRVDSEDTPSDLYLFEEWPQSIRR